MFTFHHIDKWGFANLDLIEEVLEHNSKAVVLLAGASSSGKSYLASYLVNLLKNNGHKALIISLDQYNHGLSGIIPNKVNTNYFHGQLSHLSEIKAAIKNVISDISFEKKYDEESLELIKPKIAPFFSNYADLDVFLKALNAEWKVLNFDEPSVYNMKEAALDIKALLQDETIVLKKYSKVVSERIESDEKISGSDYDVILVEGIYALDSVMIDQFHGFNNVIKDFIDGNPKSLFIRRIVRDSKVTSADNVFTISIYFKYIVKSYLETIYPNRLNADIVLFNDMTFTELRAGELYVTKDEIKTNDRDVIDNLLKNSQVNETLYQRDIFFSAPNENRESHNILRLRCLSDDEGKTYYPSSLVHKGTPKARLDNRIIRPINVLLKEGEFYKIWKDEGECLRDFLMAGFYIGPVKKKIKRRLIYKGIKLVLREVEGEGYYIEFEHDTSLETMESFAKAIKEHKLL